MRLRPTNATETLMSRHQLSAQTRRPQPTGLTQQPRLQQRQERHRFSPSGLRHTSAAVAPPFSRQPRNILQLPVPAEWALVQSRRARQPPQ